MTIAARVKRIRGETSGVEAQYGLTQWDRNFLDSVEPRQSLTEPQEKVLRGIEAKVFSEEEED